MKDEKIPKKRFGLNSSLLCCALVSGPRTAAAQRLIGEDRD
jgi:hypothetical protein